jgi:hypothetical protein
MRCQNVLSGKGGRFARCLRYFSFIIVYFAQASLSRVGADPFAFFQPSVTITTEERVRLDHGYPLARVLQAKGLEVAVLAAVPVSVDGDRLVAWERRIEELKKGSYLVAIGRFSDPPRIEDLDRLELDSGDVAAIQSCQPGNCELKLSAAEMTQLQHVEAQTGGDSRVAVQDAFRHMVLDRVKQYLANGYIPPDEDHRGQVQPSSRFGLLLEHMPFLTDRLPQLADNLRSYPQTAGQGVESFLYWSKERLARKATISVTHVRIVRNQEADLPDALIVGRDVFSTHYVDASLSVTALMRGGPERTNYLVYVNRTEVDVLHGMFGGIIRRSIQGRLKNAASVLTTIRQRLESGEPPQEPNP